jgi:hypothetical protein
MPAHPQVWVKVNAQVDHGMARIVSALNSLHGLQTVQSCEGSPEAYVYFWYGSWQQVSDLVFSGLLPALQAADIDATGAVEIFNKSLPTAKIAFNAAVLDKATAAIESFVSTLSDYAHNSASPRDTGYKAQVY